MGAPRVRPSDNHLFFINQPTEGQAPPADICAQYMEPYSTRFSSSSTRARVKFSGQPAPPTARPVTSESSSSPVLAVSLCRADRRALFISRARNACQRSQVSREPRVAALGREQKTLRAETTPSVRRMSHFFARIVAHYLSLERATLGGTRGGRIHTDIGDVRTP